jgi:deoxyribodipyrimidine photolyase-related protein
MASKHRPASVWILGNQLQREHPALKAARECSGAAPIVVLVESRELLQARPYHRQKLVLILSAMRHYAEDMRQAGYQVDCIQADSFRAGLLEHVEKHAPTHVFTMASSDRQGRVFQVEVLPDLLEIPVRVLPNQQFWVESFDPAPDAEPEKRVVMEYFYRDMRRRFEILVDENGEPEGGEWNYDTQNREPLPEEIEIPEPITFPPDAITRQVMKEVAEMDNALGHLAPFSMAVTAEQAARALDDFLENRLVHFGAYEDAMSARHPLLFHSRLSPYLNLGFLSPQQVIDGVVKAYRSGSAPLNSVEGIIRQVLGWREYMYWQYWRAPADFIDRNAWDAQRELPAFFWTGESGLRCLDEVLQKIRRTGYAHHIERLMVIANYCLLTGVRPKAVLDWFRAYFIDAYPWVMVPNVIGMGLNADGGLTATKPYIASANYINKMSDYCGDCPCDHKLRTGEGACPFNTLYWNFLDQHEERLRANPRMGFGVYNLRHLDDQERTDIRRQAQDYLCSLEPWQDS